MTEPRHLHNLEAEQCVLGSILSDNVFLEHIGALAAEHFYDPVHGRIFAQARSIVAEGRVADGLSLRDWANADPGVNGIGGSRYLMTIMLQATALTPQVVTYAAIISDLAVRRRLRAHLQGALAAVDNVDADTLATIADAEAGLRAIGDAGEASGADIGDAATAFIAGMDTPALKTGIQALDNRWGGLFPGELTILAGRPSIGKTALAAQIARNVAEQGAVVHFASLEMSKEQLAARAMSAFSKRREYGMERVEYYHLRAGSAVSRELLHELAASLPRTLIVDDRAAQTLVQLEHGARATRRRCGRLDLIVVDYLQLMTAKRADGRVNEVTEVSQGLKAVAKRLACPVIALSQLSRGVESRNDKRPMLADLRDSGAIEQDADVVAGCYRESYYLERGGEPEDVTEWRAWCERVKACRHDFDVLTLKARNGPVGADKLHVDLAFDTVVDTASTVRRAS